MALAKFLGVYATIQQLNAPNPRLQHEAGRYWFVWKAEWGNFYAQLLDKEYQPAGKPRIVSNNEFETLFVHQPHITAMPASFFDPASAAGIKDFEPLIDDLAMGQRRVPPKKTPQPADEDARAADLRAATLDRDLREEFALALLSMKRGDKAKAIEVFERLATVREGIIPAHKHMFTHFAIDLRKSNMLDLAKKHYTRALELGQDDVNAYFNMARVHYDAGSHQLALDLLNKALELSPNFAYAKQFRDFILRTSQSSDKQKQQKNPLDIKL